MGMGGGTGQMPYKDVPEEWLLAAERARVVIDQYLSIRDHEHVCQIAAAILILNGLSARPDCPNPFRAVASPSSGLEANGIWDQKAQFAYEALREYV